MFSEENVSFIYSIITQLSIEIDVKKHISLNFIEKYVRLK